MNKSELIDAMAAAGSLSKAATGQALDAFIEVVTQVVAAGKSISLVGFMTIDVMERSERVGRNPQTGDKITIPARRVPRIKAGKALKDAVQ
jgi:DNA-binding protein HU-beta